MKVRRSVLVGAVAAATLGLVPAGLAVASGHSRSATTIKFVATQTGQNFSSKTRFQTIGTDTVKGKTIGYYTLSCRFSSPKSGKCGGAGTLSRGAIYFTFPLSTTSKTFSGKVTGGTGAYSGATGKISGKTITKKKEAITITLS